ncbi:ABC transporter substrate-binding protein [Amycolatopsis sp. NBC_00345]|uniref:ABC transporter substrate-binding protein n=1 Tax=Amycolatopsis sp. NBC_00345 TaxID=2975955 RepID=UPI002E25A383
MKARSPRSPLRRRLALLAVVFVLGVSTACSATSDGGSVSVLASWTDAEGEAFHQVLQAFEDETHITVDYQGTRALDQVLAADLQRGTAPDIAVLPSPGSLAGYVRRHELQPLGFLERQAEDFYGKQWVSLQRVGEQQLYSVAVKADLKSEIWYHPPALPGAKPTTWPQLLNLAEHQSANGGTPWCLGLAAPPVSGWPGTDWIEDILLHSAGPAAYRQWAAGTLPWTSPQVRQAWLDWGALVVHPGGIDGGAPAALLTDFGDAGRPLFTDPPGCLMEHEGSFVMSSYQAMRTGTGQAPRPGTDYDFFRFPGPPVSVVSADLAGMFHDTPQSRRLMEFLVTPEAQRIWPGIASASAFSASAKVGQSVYGDPVKRKVAEALTGQSQVCFDASDLMPAAMTGAFYRAVLEYVNDPGQLDTLLSRLEDTRRAVPRSEWLDVPCGQ